VNRKGSDVYGRKGATRISEIGEPVDLALLMVPAAVLEESLNEMHAAGIRQGVVLASGYSETGAAGRAAQDALVAQARRLGITLLGPNCVGYLNYAGRAPAFTITPPMPVLRGNLAIVAQSGAVGNLASQFAHRQNIGLSCLVTTGNEADVDSGRVIDYLVDDSATRSIAVFIETVPSASAPRRAALSTPASRSSR
jgi:acyl-CoA synthetase (NDP forming)